MDVTSLKLGKLPPKEDARTLKLSAYLPPTLPSVPNIIDLSGEVAHWPMYGNDRLSDCTIAAAGHMIQLWSQMIGKPYTPTEADIVTSYETLTGGVDRGAVELDALNYWRKTGIGSDKLYAFASIEPHLHDHIKLALYWFNGVYIGVWLPKAAQDQTGPGKVWDIPEGQAAVDTWSHGSWGGHAVSVTAYDTKGLTVVTWGFLQRMTWRFWDTYVDEAWCLLPGAYEAAGGAPDILLPKLQEDLSQIGAIQ